MRARVARRARKRKMVWDNVSFRGLTSTTPITTLGREGAAAAFGQDKPHMLSARTAANNRPVV